MDGLAARKLLWCSGSPFSLRVPFTAPKASAFKQFVILDHDGIVSALSAIDGGQIDEILTKRASEGGGEFGAEVKVGPARGGGKRAKSRKVEEEMLMARTRHSAAAKLIETLHEHESVGVVDGPLDAEVGEQIAAGMVLQFRAELRLHPLHQADQMLRSLIKVAPKIGEKKSAGELRPVLETWGVLIGTDQTDSRVLVEPLTMNPQEPRLVMPVPRADFEVNVDDVLGEVTMLAQVERVLTSGEEYPAIRMLRGAPNTPLEREAIEEAMPDLLKGLEEMGVPISSGDVFIEGPALILRAICAYR